MGKVDDGRRCWERACSSNITTPPSDPSNVTLQSLVQAAAKPSWKNKLASHAFRAGGESQALVPSRADAAGRMYLLS